MGIVMVVLDDIEIKADIFLGWMNRKNGHVFSLHGQRPLAFVVFEHGNS